MQISKIAVSNQFSANQNQKVNANNNNPNFGWTFVTSPKNIEDLYDLRSKLYSLLVGNGLIHPSKVRGISIDSKVNKGVLMDVDVEEGLLKRCLTGLSNRLKKGGIEVNPIVILRKNLEECDGVSLDKFGQESRLDLAA